MNAFDNISIDPSSWAYLDLVGMSVSPKSWTPTDGSGAGLTLTSVDAIYSRIGKLVIASASITYPATADGSQAAIQGFPFAPLSNQASRQGNVSYSNNGAALSFLMDTGAATGKFFLVTGGAASNANLTASLIHFQVMYFTS